MIIYYKSRCSGKFIFTEFLYFRTYVFIVIIVKIHSAISDYPA